jgi:hypothetical protein
MAEIPVIVFYIATVALVIVALFILVLLFFLIQAARMALALAKRLEAEVGRWRDRFRFLERIAGTVGALFDI